MTECVLSLSYHSYHWMLIIVRLASVGQLSLSVLTCPNSSLSLELAYQAINPDIRIITPWRIPAFFNRFPGRSALLSYASEKGIPVTSTTAKPYSELGAFSFQLERAVADESQNRYGRQHRPL